MGTHRQAGAADRSGASLARFLLVGSAWVFLAQIVGMLSGTANQLLLPRLLRPEFLAAYFLTQSVVEVGAELGHLGLPRPVTRLVAQAMGAGRVEQARGVLRTSLRLVLLATVPVAALYAAGVGDWLAARAFDSEAMAAGTLVAALWILLQTFQNLAGGALRGLGSVGQAAVLCGALPKLLLAVALAAVLWSLGPQPFLPVLCIAVGALGLSLLAALFATARPLRGVVGSRVESGPLLLSALPLLVTGGAGVAMGRVDLWAVASLFSQEQVALYGVAKRLVFLVSVPLVIMTLVLPPVIADLYAKGELPRLQRTIRGAATLAGLPALALLLIFAVASDEVLGLAFGEFYRQAAPILLLLCIERLVFIWAGPCVNVLVMTGHERVAMQITLVAGLVMVGAIFGGASLAGFPGVAAGFVAGSVLHQVASWYAARRLTGLRTDVDPWNVAGLLETLRRTLGRP